MKNIYQATENKTTHASKTIKETRLKQEKREITRNIKRRRMLSSSEIHYKKSEMSLKKKKKSASRLLLRE